ncbi:MAG: hypothetical protein PHT54_01130 [Candidatus Nanoarchaeia archaeon]|nr:hypothetical protein [Candidatus Nanoarchaeia archaeon]
MKKLFLALILFGFVFAGVSLACVCYINPDGSSAWCEPAGCDETGDYCVEEASYCIIGSNTLSCCEGLKCDSTTKKCVPKTVVCGGVGQACCTNDACSLDTVYCSKQYYDVNGVLKTVSPHCCYKGKYWDGTKCMDNDPCNTPSRCPIVFSTPWEKFFQNPSCVYKATSWIACCSMDIYGETTSDYKAVIIY